MPPGRLPFELHPRSAAAKSKVSTAETSARRRAPPNQRRSEEVAAKKGNVI